LGFVGLRAGPICLGPLLDQLGRQCVPAVPYRIGSGSLGSKRLVGAIAGSLSGYPALLSRVRPLSFPVNFGLSPLCARRQSSNSILQGLDDAGHIPRQVTGPVA
jgi:hypothetical protein